MKTSQLVGAVVALAAMVFVVTFAMNYLGQKTPTGPGPESENVGSLDFVETSFPPQAVQGDMIGVCSEVGERSGHNFWFANKQDRPVDVGLVRKNCTCSSVQFAVIQEKDMPQLTAGYAGHAVALGTDPLARLTAFLRFGGALAETAYSRSGHAEMAEGHKVKVPPRSVGWFRLGWVGRRAERQSLWAVLWVGDPSANTIQLQVNTLVVVPLRNLGGVEVRPTRTEELPISVDVICWSPTRPSLRLKAELAHPRGGGPRSDPIEVGEPVLLPEEDRATLERELNASTYNGPVLSAYKVPVTLRRFSADGKTPLEIGQFRRVIRLSSPDEGLTAQRVVVQGSILGDVRVEGGIRGGLSFGSFPRSRGSNKRLSLTLRTEVPDLRIEVDRERTADFVEVTLPGEPEVRGKERVWRIKARIPPGKARGPFPRSEDRRYRDSAIYFKTAGETPRSIRVPVSGTANEG
jgi:hypothetical protein